MKDIRGKILWVDDLDGFKVGDKAKLIVPSHLGHGLLGDFDKVPPMRSLVIDIKLIGIKDK